MSIRQIRALIAAEDLPTVEGGLRVDSSSRFREDLVLLKSSEVGKRVQPRWQSLAALTILHHTGPEEIAELLSKL